MTKAANELLDGMFGEVIGQDEAKRKLKFYLGGYNMTQKTPYFMFSGSKGNGKTLLARELGKGLVKFDDKGRVEVDAITGKPKRKPFVEINASAIKGVKHFVNSVIIPHVNDKTVTLFIDEIHNLKHDVTNALLTILNPGSDKTQFVFDEYVCDFDHSKITFIFASSESHLIFPPLIDRMTRVDLSSYSNDEMAQIVRKHSADIIFEDSALNDIVTVLRANARSAAKCAQDIKIYLQGRKEFKNRHWQDLKHILGIKPLGLNATEISILRYLKDNNQGVSLTRLSAKTGFSREALQRDFELWPMKNNLMAIETTGRQITIAGMEYLKALDNPPINV